MDGTPKRRQAAQTDVASILRRLEQSMAAVAEGNAELMRRVGVLESTAVPVKSALSPIEAKPPPPPIVELDGATRIGKQIPPGHIVIEQYAEREKFKRYMASPKTPQRMLRVRKGEEYEAIVAGHRIIYTAGKYNVPELLYEIYEAWRERMEEAHDLARKFMATDESGQMDMLQMQKAINAMDHRPSKVAPTVEQLVSSLDTEVEPWEV